jgi:hypothetical protein
MKSFAEFITESTAPLTVAQFPILASTAPGVKRLDRIITAINAAIADNAIPNARFLELKFDVGRLIDDIRFERGNNGHWLKDVLSWAYHADVDFFQPNHAPGKLKLTQKILQKEPNNEQAKKYAEYVMEVATLHAAMEKVKTLAVKRQPAPVVDRKQQYIAPMASKDAGRKVIAVLTELTEQIKVEYIKLVYDRMADILQKYFSLKDDPKGLREFSRYNPEINRWSWYVFEKKPNGDPVAYLSGWEKYVQKEADNAGDFMQQEFLFKNAKKLAKIVELKNNLLDCKIIGRAHVMQQGIGGEIAFTFTDGSKFIVRNSVKDNRSSAGKWFSQYPTTFHNVIMPDGKPMGSPSEQRMIEVFAVAKA